MRILISINTAWNVYNFRTGLIKHLIGLGYEIHIAAPRDDYVGRLEALGCIFHALDMNNKGTSPREDFDLYCQYVALMTAIKPDVFIGYTIKPNVYGNFAAHKLRISTINNISGLGTAFIRKTWVTYVVKALYKASLKKASTVFFQNDDDCNLFKKAGLVRPESTEVLPGSGINLDTFKARDQASNSPPKFLLIARLLRDKGVGEYVEAARHLRERGVNAHLQILGFLDVANQTAVTQDEVDLWVKEGLIEYLGTSDDVRPFIKSADCIVLPSYREGTPRTLLEAAAMARPIIATNVPGCKEVVIDAETGYLCEVRNGEDLSRKMEQFCMLSSDAKKTMGQKSRALAERKFDEKIVIQAYENAIARARNTT